MKKLIIFLLFTISFLAGCSAADSAKEVVGIETLDEYLTEERIDRRMESLERLDSYYQSTNDEDLKGDAIEQLIDEYILKYEAKARDLSVNEEEVQDVIDFNIETAKKGQNENFKNYLDEMDMTVEEYYKEYAYESIKGKLLENKLNDEITANGEKWDDYKKKVIADYREKNDAEINNLMEKEN
ncbi:SurA N-terminal domain-containing protein [Bacillus salacetis]|uniref:SurA N-terminal domain-containing protein n=1 Tax=Bacillus salacetis TaxID=2315464 RepID=UPI003B9FE853